MLEECVWSTSVRVRVSPAVLNQPEPCARMRVRARAYWCVLVCVCGGGGGGGAPAMLNQAAAETKAGPVTCAAAGDGVKT